MESFHLPFRHGPVSYAGPVQFQRGRESLPAKKIQRKFRVKFKHLFLFFFLLGASFYSLIKLYLFLVSSEIFKVERAEIVCRRDFVRSDIQAVLKASKLGNLLLLDLGRLKERVEAHRWVKEARLRKIFPSALKIEIREREPAALLSLQGKFILIDREGAHLEVLTSREGIDLPVFVDSSQFRDQYQDKLALGWRFLAELPPAEAERMESIDLSRKDNLGLRFRDQPTTLYLGDADFGERLRIYRTARETLETQVGPLEYADLSIEGRIYFKPLPALAQAAPATPPPEVEQ